jgi:thioredoxin reductase (NADPH)
MRKLCKAEEENVVAISDDVEAPRRDIYDLTIIGGGPTGLFAAFYAGFREMRTKIIETLPVLGGQLVTLYPDKYVYDVAGHPEVLAKDLAGLLIEQSQRFGPTVCLEEQVLSFERVEGDIIRLGTNKGEHYTRAVMICAGVGSFQPNRLPAKNADRFEGRGVYYFVRDKNALRGKRLLIVGGGDSAMDWVLNLHDVAESITLIHRRDVFRAHESSVKKVLATGIPIHLWTEIREVLGEDKITGAVIANNQTKEERTLEVDAILGNIGFKAELGPLKEWPLDFVGRDIRVDGRMATNVPGIFAAGDVALQDGSVKLSLISVAFSQAAVAVCSAKVYVDPTSKLFPGHTSEKMGG